MFTTADLLRDFYRLLPFVRNSSGENNQNVDREKFNDDNFSTLMKKDWAEIRKVLYYGIVFGIGVILWLCMGLLNLIFSDEVDDIKKVPRKSSPSRSSRSMGVFKLFSAIWKCLTLLRFTEIFVFFTFFAVIIYFENWIELLVEKFIKNYFPGTEKDQSNLPFEVNSSLTSSTSSTELTEITKTTSEDDTTSTTEQKYNIFQSLCSFIRRAIAPKPPPPQRIVKYCSERSFLNKTSHSANVIRTYNVRIEEYHNQSVSKRIRKTSSEVFFTDDSRFPDYIPRIRSSFFESGDSNQGMITSTADFQEFIANLKGNESGQ